MPERLLGIDAGATLWKLALSREDLETEVFPAGAAGDVLRRVGEWNPDRICVTGGGAARLATALDGLDVRRVSEFEAWARGAPVLAEKAGWSLPRRYLLVSLGTGTSILSVDGPMASRAGGSALGGGTLLGLARLLCQAESFAEAAVLAGQGDRGRVDLRVRDVYPEGGIELPLDLTASSFAKLESRQPADLAHALMGLIGENLGLLCAAVARALAVETVVFGGSPLTDNPALEEVLRLTVALGGCEARFLPDGAFCGAVGAALTPPGRG
jgi:type II pantothenate kinase